MLQPELAQNSRRPLGYVVHAHCWVLLLRVVGREFVETHLRTFIKAVRQFWQENSQLWGDDPPNGEDEQFDDEDEDSDPCPPPAKLIFKNPLIVPEIDALIQRAPSSGPLDDDNHPSQLAGIQVLLKLR
jgi:hypothetical protein